MDDTENLLNVKVGVVATLTDPDDDGEVDYQEIQMPRKTELRKLLDKLRKDFTGSHIFLNNQLTELQDDDILDDVYEEGDVLTAFRTPMNKERAASQIKNASDAIVVLVNKKRQPIFIKSGKTETYKWKALDFDPIITVFRKKYQTVNGQKVEEIREDEVVYIGRQYQMPNRAKGKDVYKIKITETGVMKTDEAGHSDSISEVPGHPKEILEGAFLRQTGKKHKFNVQNKTGAPLYVITGSKWSFDAYNIPVEGEQLIKISNKFGLAQKAVETPGNREMTATMFEVLSMGEIQISKTKAKFIANLVQPGKSGEELKNIGTKLFKDKENWTKKDVLGFVMKGVTIVVGLVGMGIGAAALAGAAGVASAVEAGTAGVAGAGELAATGADSAATVVDGGENLISPMDAMAFKETTNNTGAC